MGKFFVKSVKGGVRFDLRAANGVTIATSQTYESMAACLRGINSVVKNVPAACLEDHTKEGFTEQKNPKFELFQDKGGEYRFRLKAKNGQVIAVSEGYVLKASCEKGIESVKKNVADAAIVYDQTLNKEEATCKKKGAL